MSVKHIIDVELEITKSPLFSEPQIPFLILV